MALSGSGKEKDLFSPNDQIQILENKIVAADNLSIEQSFSNVHKEGISHECSDFKQKAENEISNLKAEIEKLTMKKQYLDLCLKYSDN